MKNKKGIECSIAFIFGFLSGIVLKTLIVNSKTKFGVLKIDRSKDEKDLYSLELGDLDSLEGKKRIILKVEEINNTRK